MKKERHFPWPLVWAAEWGAMLLCCALCVFVPLWVQPYSVAQGACLYGAVPLAGLACAYASVRRGVHGLLAWIPPVGALPTGGSCAVAFLAGLLGGAAGVEKNRRKK